MRDTVFIEFGGTFQRYSGLIMRTAVAGTPSYQVSKISDACIETVNRLVEVIGPDVTGKEVVEYAASGLDPIREMVHWHGNFAYSTGLGFSPTWADCNWTIRPGGKEVIREGMALHLPIVVRIIGEVGIGFSETLIVTDRGCEVLSKSPRGLVVF
jgi:Xaa-Pro aminopeptidase